MIAMGLGLLYFPREIAYVFSSDRYVLSRVETLAPWASAMFFSYGVAMSCKNVMRVVGQQGEIFGCVHRFNILK